MRSPPPQLKARVAVAPGCPASWSWGTPPLFKKLSEGHVLSLKLVSSDLHHLSAFTPESESPEEPQVSTELTAWQGL